MNSTSTQSIDAASIVAELRKQIGGAQNLDGGWGYQPGNASRLEPTAWAILALGANGAGIDNAISCLTAMQRSDGLLAESSEFPVNYAFNALCALALMENSRGMSPAVVRLVAALTRGFGRRMAENQPDVARQDVRLVGWPWIPGTFSWLEPTAFCLLALKRFRQVAGTIAGGARERIEQGEELLLDRACAGGGWNYGNPNVYGKELFPYVPTTALALLALQDRRDDPAVQNGLGFLRARGATERSGVALALASLCLHVYGVQDEEIVGALVGQWTSTGFLRNGFAIAMALYCLTVAKHDARALRV